MKKILDIAKPKDEETKEVRAKYNEFEEKKASVKKIRDRFHAYMKKNSATVEEGRSFSEAVQEYAVTLLGSNQGSVLGSCLFEVSQMQKFLEDTMTDLCSYSLKQLDEPLEAFVARETENAQAVKKRYDKARSSLDSMQKSDNSEDPQHTRNMEIADEAMEQLRQVDTALDLHALGFTSRYMQCVHTVFHHLALRCEHASSVLEKHSSSHFFEEIDQFEVETGRRFATFTGTFLPAWASSGDVKKPNSPSSGVPIQEIRKKEISDLLKKERVYVDTLKSLVKIYLFEFRNNRQVTKVVSLQDLEDLFSNIEDILDIHQDFTWDLQAALEPPFHTSLAELLLEFIPKLEPYMKYIANSSKSADTLARLMKDRRYVATAIKQCSEKDRLGRSLIDLLQTYRSFAENALAATPTSSADYDPLDDALSMVIRMDEKVMNAIQIAKALLAISRRIEAGEEIVTTNPSRRLIKEAPASTLESQVTLLLFSDLLIVCVEGEYHLEWRRVTLANVLNAIVPGGTTVQIEIQGEPPLAFSLPSYFEAQTWVDDIKSTLQNLCKTKVFGVPLLELMTKNEREKDNDVPSFIAEALDTIDATGLEVEGIFRVSGSVLTIRGIKDSINQGLPVDYRAPDIHAVAGMVQTWIRELPEPLMTYSLYNEWIGHASKGLEIGPLRATVAKLPQAHRFMLQYLCQFLSRVASFGKVNKMRTGNLAIVFGPSLLYERNTASNTNTDQQPQDSTLVQFLSFASVHLRDVYTVVQYLIENYKEVFEGVEDERETFREKVQKEKIASLQAEMAIRAEERKAIKERRIEDERIRAEVEAASNPELVRQAEEKRKAKRDERERQMREEKEQKERERRRLEDEERAQLEEIKRQRWEAEENKRLERQRQEIAEIEQRHAEAQARLQQEEDKVREERRLMTQQEKERQAKAEEEFKARETARKKEAVERAEREARERDEQERLHREREARERAEAVARAEAALPVCAACGARVRDGVSSKDRGLIWHRECYKCSECHVLISGGFSMNGKSIICAACTQKKAGTAKGVAPAADGCGICGKALSGRVVKIGEKRIHKACFICEKCSGSLDDGYYEVHGKILCENCSTSK